MRLLLTVTTAVLMGVLVLPTSEAGMDDWFKGWGGGGKGGKGRGRRRPAGHYRPIYIHAPPIVQHAPRHPPPTTLYKKPTIPSYGYGAPSKGFSSHGKGGFATTYGKGFSNLGISSSLGKGFSSGGGFATSYGSPSIISTSYKAPSIKYSAPATNFVAPSTQFTTTYSSGSFGGGNGFATTYGGLSSGGGHHGKGFSHGGAGGFSHGGGKGFSHGGSGGFSHGNNKGFSHGGAHINEISHGLSYEVPPPHGGLSGKVVPHKQGFGPIKEDDLIVVQGESHGAAGGYKDVQIHGLSAPHGAAPASYSNDVSAIHPHGLGESAPIKGGRHVSFDPPPVYVPGSNSISNNVAPNFHEASIEAKDLGALSLTTDYKTEQFVGPQSSAPLPMAEHGTSSLSYLENPPAPLYSVEGGSEGVHSIGSGGSFNPSKQIPFPGELSLQEHYQTSDVETSHSAPAVGISSAPQIEAQSSSFGRQIHHGSSQVASEAVVSFDNPLDYSDPIIEIVFEDPPEGHIAPAPVIDPSLYQPQSDDVEVYFIEVSDDGTYETVDDLDLSQALAGVKEEFPEGLPSELSQTLINSGYLDNAQIEVLDLQSALGDNSLDHSVRSALREAYGSESRSVATVVEAPSDQQAVEMRLKRLVKDAETVEGDAELARELGGRFRQARYGGVVELNDKESEKYLPVEVDGNLIPIPEHPELQGRKISGVLVYADNEKNENGQTSSKANVVLSTSRRGRQINSDDKDEQDWTQGDWTPVKTMEKKIKS